MLMRVFSDIHQEFKKDKLKSDTHTSLDNGLWHPLRLETDKDTVLVLAGDIWNKYSILKYGNWEYSWITKLSKQFKAIVFVLGNHDYWNNSLDLPNKLKQKIAEMSLDNVFLLEKDSVVIDGYRFIGATLWTNIPSHAEKSYLYQLTCPKGKEINDFKYIRVNSSGSYVKFRINHYTNEYRKSIQFMQNEIEQSIEPVVVISHHAPVLSVYKEYDHAPECFKYFDANDLENYLLTDAVQNKVKAWAYGHIHYSQISQVGNITLINNAVGYTNLTENHQTISLFEY